MTAPGASEPGTSALVGGHYSAALENLRSTVKWLVASSGAVAAAIIGGAQLVDYSHRNWLGACLSAIAVATALSLALYLLLAAARILTIPRKTVTELANAETREPRTAVQTATFKNPSVEWILARKDYLLGPYVNVRALLAAYGKIDVAKISENRDVVNDIERRIARIEEAIHYRDVSQAYGDLLAKFKWGARVFVGAVVLFSIAGLFHAKSDDQSPKDWGHPVCCAPICATTTSAPSSTPAATSAPSSTPTTTSAPSSTAVSGADPSPPVTNGKG
jgi:hypothetical protein